MRKSIKLILVAVLIASLGGLGGYWVRGHQLSHIPNTWYEINRIPLKGNDSGLTYTTQALFDADIPLPDITSAKAKVKFLPMPGEINYQLGYVITVDIAKLDPEKVPGKYKEKKTEKSKSGEWTLDPLKEVVYELNVSFELQDQDGFRLIEVKGPKHNVFSGQSNVLQEVVETPISVDISKRTKVIVPKVNVEKCVSCK
jgi:hypothetical protein